MNAKTNHQDSNTANTARVATLIICAVLWIIFSMSVKAAALDNTGVATLDNKEVAPPDTKVEVSIETSKGSFAIELYPDKAPLTVENFVGYVRDGFYNETLFHRVVSDFVVQAGGFQKGMKLKATKAGIENESLNGLKNERGAVAMARQRQPDSATSQFFVNLKDNDDLDPRGSQFGYTVFGKVISGMDVIDKIAALPVEKVGPFKNVPSDDVLIVSAKIMSGLVPTKASATRKQTPKKFIAGQHYIELADTEVHGFKQPRNSAAKSSKAVEVVEVFSYGCQHCYRFEKIVMPWADTLKRGVEFRKTPAIWNGLMRLFAHTFYTIEGQKKPRQLHQKLFDQIVLDGRPMLSESMIGAFFSENGVDEKAFATAFDSTQTAEHVVEAEALMKVYQIESIPALIINGKYRVSAATAGSQKAMLEVADYLIEKEQGSLDQQ